MADVNTENQSGDFVFGQNMEERVVKSPVVPGQSEQDNKDSPPSGVTSTTPAAGLLRPSAFKPSGASGGGGGVLLAPSKFQARGGAGNLWKTPTTTTEASSTEGKQSTGCFSNNPFAEVKSHHAVSTTNSDSEEEHKERPLVAPGHNFTSNRNFIGASKLAMGTASPSKCLLRPSALDRQTQQMKPNSTSSEATNALKTSFKLEPAKLQSPFGISKDTGQSNKENEASVESSSTSKAISAEANHRLFGEQTAGATDGSKESPSTVESSTAEAGTSEEEPAKFVFGQNLGDRVVAGASCSSSSASTPKFMFGENLSDRVTSSAAEGGEGPVNNDAVTDTTAEAISTKSLEESAAAEQAKHTKTIPEEVEVKTGEEDESNVFQLNAKLYAFEKETQNWLERGRGTLRLNDLSSDDETAFQSRLVMRTHGSLRVIFNTKIWAGQTLDRASPKSIRLSAWDGDEGIKIFLIMANPKDADQIFSAIDWRIQQANSEEQKRKDSPDKVSNNKTSPGKDNTQKRKRDGDEPSPPKKQKVDGEPRKVHLAEESNDSSTVDPETEASNESFTSSPTVKSTSSDN